ncbi:MAG TPA: N-acetyltransferase [Vicinamibacterales bacterium]|nr:N-acetyltransferase [Vicinamibacterales bacterium]
MSIEIRGERPDDVAAIREVNRLAFGQDQEANIVDSLRSGDGLRLSLVAALDDRIVGHVAYSPVVAHGVAGAGLGPVAVLPDHQRQGIGSALIKAGNARLHDAGCPFIVVLGHPGYYPRFGFRPASTYGLTCEWDVPDGVFMVLVLDESTLLGASGRVKYRQEFSTVA